MSTSLIWLSNFRRSRLLNHMQGMSTSLIGFSNLRTPKLAINRSWLQNLTWLAKRQIRFSNLNSKKPTSWTGQVYILRLLNPRLWLGSATKIPRNRAVGGGESPVLRCRTPSKLPLARILHVLKGRVSRNLPSWFTSPRKKATTTANGV